MCRFTFYLGEPLPLAALLTIPDNSLIHQSTHTRERVEPLYADDEMWKTVPPNHLVRVHAREVVRIEAL